MKALLDINVLLDVVQNRQPHYADSAAVLSAARTGEFTAVLPVHAITTVFYLVEKASGALTAGQVVDWLLQHFDVPPADRAVLVRARAIPMTDFEDAVVASLAERHQCDYIVSRNAADFVGSTVRALTPADFLKVLAASPQPPQS